MERCPRRKVGSPQKYAHFPGNETTDRSIIISAAIVALCSGQIFQARGKIRRVDDDRLSSFVQIQNSLCVVRLDWHVCAGELKRAHWRKGCACVVFLFISLLSAPLTMQVAPQGLANFIEHRMHTGELPAGSVAACARGNVHFVFVASH